MKHNALAVSRFGTHVEAIPQQHADSSLVLQKQPTTTDQNCLRVLTWLLDNKVAEIVDHNEAKGIQVDDTDFSLIREAVYLHFEEELPENHRRALETKFTAQFTSEQVA